MPHLGDVEPLETLVRDMAARLVIVDPLVAFLPPRVDANKDAEVRQGLAPIAALAERTGCAVVGVRHLTRPPPCKPSTAVAAASASSEQPAAGCWWPRTPMIRAAASWPP
jgi:hypothetical protein